MENSTPKSNNAVWIIAGVVLLIGAVLYFVVYGSKPNAEPTLTDAEKAAKEKVDMEAAKAKSEADAKAKAEKEAADKLKNPPCYKKPINSDTVRYDTPRAVDLDYYVSTMRDMGWSDDLISYGAAWMKGMDLPVNTHWAKLNIKNIRDFQSKVPGLPRSTKFSTEVRNYPFMPGDLVCEGIKVLNWGLNF
jgi:hypothetical protein